jgi:hypothetical protein
MLNLAAIMARIRCPSPACGLFGQVMILLRTLSGLDLPAVRINSRAFWAPSWRQPQMSWGEGVREGRDESAVEALTVDQRSAIIRLFPFRPT